MTVLVWKHGTTRAAAKKAVSAELAKLGYEGKVRWKGDSVTASIGLGLILSARGRVTDEAVVIDHCGGALGDQVLDGCRDMLRRAFPGGQRA